MDNTWHAIDQPALARLSQATTSPGQVYSVHTSLLPQQLQQIPGVVSYYVSGYTNLETPSPGLTQAAEIAVVRSDGSMLKAYNYAIASSSNGSVYFAGPFQNFPEHHLQAGKQVPVEKLFGHTKTPGKGKGDR